MSVEQPNTIGLAEVPSEVHAPGTTPRDDVVGGLLWMVLGTAILVGSWRMDRLEAQDINRYTIPGLVPGLLGLAMMFFAALMALRGWRNGGLHRSAATSTVPRAAYGRLAAVLVLCIGFVGLLLGLIPFWAAASLFVTLSIGVLRWGELKLSGRLGRGLLLAGVIGVCAGVAVTLVFEQIFLVRLP
jgi:hypothetical protein